MFEGWDSFYLLVGGAAGALIGLLFIVVTLMRGGDSGTRLRAASVFMTPTVAKLAMVLLLSALATAPGIPMSAAGVIFSACALICLGFTGRALLMLSTGSIKASHWSDLWGDILRRDLVRAGLGRSRDRRQRHGDVADRHPQRLGPGHLDRRQG
jgi:hypothetical protein